ncbi:Heat shock 22 kDa protein [Spatholobus suberectus]|nr:Heat shock 22 kDa protein [Spatholobus suberectus]
MCQYDDHANDQNVNVEHRSECSFPCIAHYDDIFANHCTVSELDLELEFFANGEGAKEGEEEESARRYSSRIDLPNKLYKIDQIKAEIKNGVVKVVVLKVKEEERSNVINVKVLLIWCIV